MKTAIIVDDEPRNADQLRYVLSEAAPEITVAGIASNTLEALALIRKKQPDILFLDIEMQGPSGFDLLPHIEVNTIKIIFVTAHSNHTIRALRAGADDYLLKPVTVEEMKACLDRIFLPAATTDASEKRPVNDILRFPVKDGSIFIRRSELMHVEGAGSYTNLYLQKGVRHMISKNIGQVEKLLSDDSRFFRCHNSHIVNLQFIERFINTDGNFVQLSDGSQAEVSRKMKEELFRLLGGK